MQNKQQQKARTYFGYTIIESISISENEEMVLGVKSLNGQTRFKTWKFRRGFYKSGQNFSSFELALQNLQKRANEWVKDKQVMGKWLFGGTR